MDKRIKRNEASDKKTDSKGKDRGDLKKVCDKIIQKSNENTQVDMKVAYPERGDSESKTPINQKPEKMRLNIVVKKPNNEEWKSKTVIDGAAEKEFANKKNTDKDRQDKAQYDLELRKRIRDKYTLKLKSPVNKSEQSNLNLNKKDDSKVAAVKGDGSKIVDRPKNRITEETTQTKEKLTNSSPSSAKTDLNPDKKPDKGKAKPDNVVANVARRKPMIKTITSKSGSVRIYKAVTFVDQTRNLTPLEINIPGDAIRKQKVSKFTDTSSLSRSSVKEKPVRVRKKSERRRDKKIKHVASPDCLKEVLSPPTEVARWAPASIDRQTKPYYEAWVNTTLAAISKNSKKDQLFYEKQRENILSLQRALVERPRTPELFYENFADEKYTGRIKITQRMRHYMEYWKQLNQNQYL